jgi:hypothetical protein
MPISKIDGVPPTPPVAPTDTPPTDPQTDIRNSPEFHQTLQKVAANVLQGGNSMLQEAMQKMNEEEEPDEDDPDAEPL